MQRSWRFRQPLREVVVIRKADATPKDLEEALPTIAAAAVLRDVVREIGVARNLGLGLLYEMTGLPHATLLPPRNDSRWIAERLEEALLRGRLLVIPKPIPVGSGIGVNKPVELEPVPVPEPPQEEEEEKTWIEIELLNKAGEPIPGEPFVVTLADGSIKEGRLNRDGFARLDNIVDGTCKVTFPNFDGREWAPK